MVSSVEVARSHKNDSKMGGHFYRSIDGLGTSVHRHSGGLLIDCRREA
jgi:hypothetical protein